MVDLQAVVNVEDVDNAGLLVGPVDDAIGCLAGIRGVTPPVTREHVSRGAFHGYEPFFTASECPGVPKELYVEAGASGYPGAGGHACTAEPEQARYHELPGPVGLGTEAAAGDAVMKPHGYLIDPVPLAEDIDDQGGFHAPAPGQAAA
jgi:hypothetical protein